MAPKIIAFDPGQKGAIAIGSTIFDLKAVPMPMAGKEIDLAAIKDLLLQEGSLPDRAIIEKVSAMPGQGVTSMFTFGSGYGKIQGLLMGLSIPTELVASQRWKGKVLADTPKDKDAAIAYCRRVFPNIRLVLPRCTKPHDGLADVICMWEYARRTYYQGESNG